MRASAVSASISVLQLVGAFLLSKTSWKESIAPQDESR